MKFPIPFVTLFLVSFFTPNQAAAQEATAMTGEQMLAHCQQKWGSRASAVAQCVTNLRLAASESRDDQIVARLDEGEERDGEILERLDELGEKVDALASAQSRPATHPAPATVATTTSTGVAYARTGGVNWVPVTEPFVMSIHNIEGLYPDTLHITSLEHPDARKTCGGEGAPLVVFYDHGVPGTNLYAPQGAPSGFVEVYYDKNADGTSDGQVLALDLASQTDVWVTWGLQNDLTVRYLRPGQRILVEKRPGGEWEYETIYHPTTRQEASASGSIGCDRDKNARRGGNQPPIPAYSLSRMW